MRGLTNKTVVAIATSPLKEGNPFVYIGAVCFSRPSPNVRHWFVVIFAYWLHSPSTSTAVRKKRVFFVVVAQRLPHFPHFSPFPFRLILSCFCLQKTVVSTL
jgi:hypothetical protein